MKTLFRHFLFFFFLLCSCAFETENNPTSEAHYFLEGYPVLKLYVKGPRVQWENNGLTVFGASIPFQGDSVAGGSGVRFSSLEKSVYAFQNSFPLISERGDFSFLKLISNKAKPTSNNTLNDDVLGQGTGFLATYKEKVYLITNFHVSCCFDKTEDLSIEVFNPYFPRLQLKAKKIVSLIRKYDIAVLELEDSVSFDESIQLLPMDEQELSGREVEIRGFPSSNETLIPVSVPSEVHPNLSDSSHFELCLKPETHLEPIAGSSGSPVFLKGTKNIVGMLWAGIRNIVSNRVHRILSIPIKKVMDAIDNGFECEGWDDCFIRAYRDLQRSYLENDPFALRALKSELDCTAPEEERPSYCGEPFFSDLNQRIRDNPVECLHVDP